jgi:hypothetical protein
MSTNHDKQRNGMPRKKRSFERIPGTIDGDPWTPDAMNALVRLVIHILEKEGKYGPYPAKDEEEQGHGNEATDAEASNQPSSGQAKPRNRKRGSQGRSRQPKRRLDQPEDL